MGATRDIMQGREDKVRVFTIPFETTAAAEDIDVGVFKAKRTYRVLDAKVFFHGLDTFSAGVDIDLETDDGTTETAVANYDTVSGTVVGTWYDFTFTANPVVDAGEWLQIRINDDEDAACRGVVMVEVVPEDL